MDDLHIRTWFGVVQNVAVDKLLWTSFTDCYISEIFHLERKTILWHSQPAAVESTQKKVNTIAADTKMVDVHRVADGGPPIEEHYLCSVVRQVTIRAYSHAAVKAASSHLGFMMIENHQSIVERRCPMTLGGPMDIFP